MGLPRNRGRARRADGSFLPKGPVDEAEIARQVSAPHRFQPKQSGNPGGRAPGERMLKERIAELTDDGVELVNWMNNVRIGVEEGMTDDRVRFAAAEWMSDRYFGKVKQTVAVEPGPGSEPSPPVPLDALLQVLDDRDRADLERILVNFEMARRDGRLELPAPIDVDSEELPKVQ